MRITFLPLIFALAFPPGCDNLSLNIMLPTGGADGPPGESPSPAAPALASESFFLCVVNQSSEQITYRVSVIGLDPIADAAGAGASVCYDAPCGFDFGIDEIAGATIRNPLGGQFLADQAPCGSVFELRVQTDGAVLGVVNTGVAVPRAGGVPGTGQPAALP